MGIILSFNPTTTASEASVQPVLRISTEYLRTIPGKLKVAVIILGMICSIILPSIHRSMGSIILSFAVSLGLFESTTTLVFYLLNIPETFCKVIWATLETAAIGIVTLLYFIGSLLVIVTLHEDYTMTDGVFGFITTTVYGYSGYIKIRDSKSTPSTSHV